MPPNCAKPETLEKDVKWGLWGYRMAEDKWVTWVKYPYF